MNNIIKVLEDLIKKIEEEAARCWRCGAEIEDCCCGETSPITFTEAIDILNELHLRGLLEEFEELYPHKVDDLDFEKE